MNIFIACDGQYYQEWGINCVKSIQYYVPWIKITVHIVNPIVKDELPEVHYFYEEKNFENEISKTAYYQAVRFIKCYDYFSNDELVMTIDCDTLLSKSFSQAEFKKITETIHVQRHQKADRWMAGLVTYGKDNSFRKKYQEELLRIPIKDWPIGYDQTVLNNLANEFKFQKLLVGDWMSFGRGRGIFLTLKGDQKIGPGYLKIYQEVLDKIQ